MAITAPSIYPGPSLYAEQPAFHVALADSLQPRPVSGAMLQALYADLPGLQAHIGVCGGADGLGHLFEHVCIELQNLAGSSLACVRGQALLRIDTGCAVVPYEESDVCGEAILLAGELLAHLVSTVPSGFAFRQRFAEFIEHAAATMLPVQDRALIRAARALDIPAARLAGRILVLGHGRFQRRMSATKTSLTSVVGNDLAANKDYSRRVLGDLGLPVPRYARVRSARAATMAARRIGYPVVVKPNNGSMGGGVSVGMKNRREVDAAYRRARQFDRSVLVEEVIKGDSYRLLVIGGKLQAAAKCVPGHVIGDGTHSIEELVVALNSDPRRGTGPACTWTPIQLDEQADRLIADLGCTRLSVPRPGETVYLRRNGNTSDGGTTIDVTDDVHPDNRYVAERAAKAIGLDIAGVDLLMPDIASSIFKCDGRICEINSRPGVRKHLWPTEGTPRDVLTPMLAMLFPPERPGRIPIVAITGTGDTHTTAHMLAHLLATGGHHVGLSAGQRVYSGGRRIGRARLAAPAAVRMILLDPDVDVAVLEIRPDDVLRHGLLCDAVNVAAVIGVSQPGPVADAIRVVARSARDIVYVDAADPCAAAIERDGGRARLRRMSDGTNYARAAARKLGMEPADIRRGLRTFKAPKPRAAPSSPAPRAAS